MLIMTDDIPPFGKIFFTHQVQTMELDLLMELVGVTRKLIEGDN